MLADRGLRDDRIREAHLRWGYSLAEIGERVGLHYPRVSRLVSASTPSHGGNEAKGKT